MRQKVGVLLFDDVELLDFAGPCEVFSAAKNGNEDCFEVITFGMTSFPVQVYGGIEVIPNLTISNQKPLDLLIIPGGYGIFEILKDAQLHDWLRFHAEQNTRIASVCTGAFILAELGFLNGLRATTHDDDLIELQTKYPQIQSVDNVRFIDEGKFLTSAGVSAGIDMSLYLVEQIYGVEIAQKCRRRLSWQ